MEQYFYNITATYMYTSIHAQCSTPARFVYNSKQQQPQQQWTTTSPNYIKDNAATVMQAMQL